MRTRFPYISLAPSGKMGYKIHWRQEQNNVADCGSGWLSSLLWAFWLVVVLQNLTKSCLCGTHCLTFRSRTSKVIYQFCLWLLLGNLTEEPDSRQRQKFTFYKHHSRHQLATVTHRNQGEKGLPWRRSIIRMKGTKQTKWYGGQPLKLPTRQSKCFKRKHR